MGVAHQPHGRLTCKHFSLLRAEGEYIPLNLTVRPSARTLLGQAQQGWNAGCQQLAVHIVGHLLPCGVPHALCPTLALGICKGWIILHNHLRRCSELVLSYSDGLYIGCYVLDDSLQIGRHIVQYVFDPQRIAAHFHQFRQVNDG